MPSYAKEIKSAIKLSGHNRIAACDDLAAHACIISHYQFIFQREFGEYGKRGSYWITKGHKEVLMKMIRRFWEFAGTIFFNFYF
ncbi:MAG: hypothetical protein C6W57_03675 [Caldibacillus debilis]|nr:MAG: hypothetical protein C6W57_03675 [Caldibacillus debilis]